MKLLSLAFLLFVTGSLLLLDAGNASAAPIAIPRPSSAVSVSPILAVRGKGKGSSSTSSSNKKNASSSSSGSSKAKAPPVQPSTPGPSKAQNPKAVDIGIDPRPGGPKAYVVDQNSRWGKYDRAAQKFLDHERKDDGGTAFAAKIGTAANGDADTLWSENEKGQRVHSRIKKGHRIDNQGNAGKDQVYNVQAQTNGDDPLTYGTTIGWTGNGANGHEILASLRTSAQKQAPVHLVSQDWSPQAGQRRSSP